MHATLDKARIPVQCDMGFGDAITPAPSQQTYPTLLGRTQCWPLLQAAAKLEAP